MAVILLKEDVIDAVDYTDGSRWASDPRIEALRKIIKGEKDKSLTEDYLNPKTQSCTTRFKVTLKSGEDMEEMVEFPLGYPLRIEERLGHVAVEAR